MEFKKTLKNNHLIMFSIQVFELWENEITEFVMKSEDVRKHPHLKNKYQRRRYIRDLEGLISLRLCLILFLANQNNKAPYTLYRLTKKMGAKNNRQINLRKKQIKHLLERISIFKIVEYEYNNHKCGHYTIKASDKLLDFFNQHLMLREIENRTMQ